MHDGRAFVAPLVSDQTMRPGGANIGFGDLIGGLKPKPSYVRRHMSQSPLPGCSSISSVTGRTSFMGSARRSLRVPGGADGSGVAKAAKPFRESFVSGTNERHLVIPSRHFRSPLFLIKPIGELYS
jgi:hypothetical protein